MYKPTLAELEAMKTEYKIVPVSKEIFADLTTPIKVLKILKISVIMCIYLKVWRIHIIGADILS